CETAQAPESHLAAQAHDALKASVAYPPAATPSPTFLHTSTLYIDARAERPMRGGPPARRAAEPRPHCPARGRPPRPNALGRARARRVAVQAPPSRDGCPALD